jgi:hypothetical protein
MFGEMMNRAETFAAYNEHIAEACAAGKGRLFPVMVPNYWDPAEAAASVARCKALGARCLMVPIKPGKDVDGELIQYSDPKLDPLWSAIAGRRGHLRPDPDAGLSPYLGSADLWRGVRPVSRAEGGVRRRRHLLGRLDAARRRHDL